MTLDTVMWGVMLMALTGTIANIYKKVWGFYLWAISNLCWAAYDWHLGAYSQAAMMAVYFVLAVWGIIKWSKEGK